MFGLKYRVFDGTVTNLAPEQGYASQTIGVRCFRDVLVMDRGATGIVVVGCGVVCDASGVRVVEACIMPDMRNRRMV